MSLHGTHLCTLDVRLGPVREVGMTPAGYRRVIPIVGGTVSGGIEGRVLPGGADWNLVGADGSGHLWARYELELADGTIVSVTNRAAHAAGHEGPILTSPQFDVGEDGPTELRHGVHVGVLDPLLEEQRVHIEVYRIDLAG